MGAVIFIYINCTVESKKEPLVKGQSTGAAFLLLFTTGHILQQTQWEGINPNPISPAPSLCDYVCVFVSIEEPKLCLTHLCQDVAGIYEAN